MLGMNCTISAGMPAAQRCVPMRRIRSALGVQNGGGPGGVFVLDHYDFQILGRWEVDRGPQFLGYDSRWHLGHDVAITSEWGPTVAGMTSSTLICVAGWCG
jgi:hypothetical protein